MGNATRLVANFIAQVLPMSSNNVMEVGIITVKVNSYQDLRKMFGAEYEMPPEAD